VIFTFQLSQCLLLSAEGVADRVADFRLHQIRCSYSFRVRQGGQVIPGRHLRRKYFQHFLGRKPESERVRGYRLSKVDLACWATLAASWDTYRIKN